ncbi:MAG: hypothetical protein K5865_06745 [Eubacterium sp.]|nr:hypothetical protein [Eubacterium sp.]
MEDVSGDTSNKISGNGAPVNNASGSKSGSGASAGGALSTPSKEWRNGRWYNSDGTSCYEGIESWKSNSKGWWYEDSLGWYPSNQYLWIDGTKYWFGASGYWE